ncbi:MAG: O-antigen ligase family protein, partial [Pyrinomonadaceae bacterium]
MKPQNFLSHLIYLFLFVLPLQTIYFLREPFVGGVKWEYGVIGIYAIDLLLLVCVMWFLTEAFFFKKYQIPNIKYQISDLILLVFLFWAGVSIFWASDQMLASYFFMKLLLASGLFFVVRLIEVDMKKVVFVLLVAGVLQGGIGIAQFLTQESVDSSIFGMSAHNASQAGSSVLKIDSGRFLRAYGTFPHPNVLGGFLGVILVLCISYYVSAIKEKESYKLQVTSYKKNEIPPLEDSVGMTIEGLMLTGGSIIILLGLLLTFSRTAWLGALLGLVVIGLSAFKQKDYWIRRKFVKIFLALGMAGLVFGFILHEQIFPRFDTKAIEHEGSVSERIVSLQDAWTLINNHPIV